jgi:tetratricopeptide (TPR) repeat protein
VGPSIEDHLRAGRFEAAIAAADAAVRSGGAAADWLRLAQALAAARRPEEALASAARGLAAFPTNIELLCVQAAILIALSRTAEARGAYETVLVADPDRFEAAFGLALLAADAGDWVVAQAQLARLQVRHPDRPDLKWLSARAAMSQGKPAQALEGLEPLARDARLAPAQRAEVLLLLSAALDALDHCPEAFAAAVRGKQIERDLYAERARDREGAAGRFARLRDWFEAADPEPWAGAPAPDKTPAAGHAFLVGFPRSGTTLLEQALAGHPQVAALEEAPTLAAAHAEFLSDDAGLERLARLTAKEAKAWRERYWAEVAARGVDVKGRLFLDKAPAATEDLPLVAKLFPDAKVLFAIRDPRDVVLSCLRQAFQMNALTYAFTDLIAAASAYAANMALAETYRHVLPLHLMEVRHETLVRGFEGKLRQVCAFLELEFDPAMTDVGRTAARREVRTPSAVQVRAGLSRKGLGRWRAYQAELAPVLPVLAPWVERFGYKP